MCRVRTCQRTFGLRASSLKQMPSLAYLCVAIQPGLMGRFGTTLASALTPETLRTSLLLFICICLCTLWQIQGFLQALDGRLCCLESCQVYIRWKCRWPMWRPRWRPHVEVRRPPASSRSSFASPSKQPSPNQVEVPAVQVEAQVEAEVATRRTR